MGPAALGAGPPSPARPHRTWWACAPKRACPTLRAGSAITLASASPPKKRRLLRRPRPSYPVGCLSPFTKESAEQQSQPRSDIACNATSSHLAQIPPVCGTGPTVGEVAIRASLKSHSLEIFGTDVDLNGERTGQGRSIGRVGQGLIGRKCVSSRPFREAKGGGRTCCGEPCRWWLCAAELWD